MWGVFFPCARVCKRTPAAQLVVRESEADEDVPLSHVYRRRALQLCCIGYPFLVYSVPIANLVFRHRVDI